MSFSRIRCADADSPPSDLSLCPSPFKPPSFEDAAASTSVPSPVPEAAAGPEPVWCRSMHWHPHPVGHKDSVENQSDMHSKCPPCPQVPHVITMPWRDGSKHTMHAHPAPAARLPPPMFDTPVLGDVVPTSTSTSEPDATANGVFVNKRPRSERPVVSPSLALTV